MTYTGYKTAMANLLVAGIPVMKAHQGAIQFQGVATETTDIWFHRFLQEYQR